MGVWWETEVELARINLFVGMQTAEVQKRAAM